MGAFWRLQDEYLFGKGDHVDLRMSRSGCILIFGMSAVFSRN